MKKKEINYQLLIRRICLIVLDIICIIAASILALLTRFEFDFSQIPKEFLKVIYKYGPFTIVITLIIMRSRRSWMPEVSEPSVMNGNIRRSGIYSGVRKKRSWLMIR